LGSEQSCPGRQRFDINFVEFQLVGEAGVLASRFLKMEIPLALLSLGPFRKNAVGTGLCIMIVKDV
jgi:hypothetical protein